MLVSGQTVIIGFAIVVGTIVAASLLSLPFVIAHKAVITRRQLKVMAQAVERSERELQSRSLSQERWVTHEREAYAFLVGFRSKARFLRWFYWISILTIPVSGWGLLMLALWALQHSDLTTATRAATGKKPKALAKALCSEIERSSEPEAWTRS